MKILLRSPLCLLVACLLAFEPVLRTAAATPIVATALLRLKQRESPALSPDDRGVTYVVRSIAPKPDAKDDWTYQSHLWLVSADGSSPPCPLTARADHDRRTGFVQSEMLLRSLKVLGRDVEAVRYPRASHEMSRSGEPKQRLDSLVRYEEFFRRHLGNH